MILSVEDRLEIFELYARYCHCFDAGEAEPLAGLFTADGTFTIQPAAGIIGRELNGHAELVANVLSGHEGRFKKRGIRHWVTNIVLDATESGASGTAYVMAVRVGDQQPPQITSTGRDVDEFVKVAGRWRFRSRKFLPDVY